MKWINIIFALLLFCTVAGADQIKLQWDLVDNVDGYRIYSAIRADTDGDGQVEHEYDFTNPLTTELYPDGNIPVEITEMVVDLSGPPEETTKYMFVARAFAGADESENSNEVVYVVNNITPEPPTELSGGYDKDNDVINISWSQPEEVPWSQVDHWIVFFRLSDDSEWVELGRVNKDHELALAVPFDQVAPGTSENIDFVVVAYRQGGVYSGNSDILSLHIDRRVVPPIQNLRISIEIPVQ